MATRAGRAGEIKVEATGTVAVASEEEAPVEESPKVIERTLNTGIFVSEEVPPEPIPLSGADLGTTKIA